MTELELKNKIKAHGEWLLDNAKGERLELIGAELRDSDLSGADLAGADFRATNLSGADLSQACLVGANLTRANLSFAELVEADLSRSNLDRAHLSRANLEGARLPHYQVSEGCLIGWKKIEGEVVKVRIPESSKRTACLISRTCRAERVIVLEIADGRLSEITGGYAGLSYRVGETIHADRFDSDPREECAHGVHFFRTRAEAEEYDLR